MTDALASAAMVAYCGWDPTTPVANETVLLDGNNSPSIFLPSLYVTGVSAVVLTLPDGSTYNAQIGTGLDCNWDQKGELRWLPTAATPYIYWPEGLQNIAVTFSGGYSSAPADLTAALNSLTARMPQIQSAASSAKVGTASLTFAASLAAGGLLNVEQWVFDKYRIPKVGR